MTVPLAAARLYRVVIYNRATVSCGDRLAAIFTRKSGDPDKIYYVHKDHLGSIVKLTDGNGTTVFKASYDVWGKQTVTNNTFAFHRGYTGHEHLNEFGLINMNGRMYDPNVGRFLSPDPFVQAPDFSQSFNRYSYCLNNPLIYTDPSGENPLLIVAGIGFLTGYVSHGISTNNWGMNAAYSGLFSSAAFTLGYLGAGLNANSVLGIFEHFSTTGALKYAGMGVLNTALSHVMPSYNAPLGNFSLSISPGIGFGSNGLVGGINISGTYHDGDNAYTLGLGHNTNSVSFGIGYGNSDWGISYYATKYGNAIGPDGLPNSQIVGGLSYRSGKFSAKIENDFLAKNGDRWRSNAVELGFWGGKAVLGTTLYNNFRDKNDPVEYVEYEHKTLFGKKYGRWIDGQTYSSPLYVGIRSGNNITRLGYSHRIFQHTFQNWFVHEAGFARSQLFGHANYFMDYDNFKTGPYGYSGYYNPYSLWGR